MGFLPLLCFFPPHSVGCKCVESVATNDQAFRLSLRKSGISTDWGMRKVVGEKSTAWPLQTGSCKDG